MMPRLVRSLALTCFVGTVRISSAQDPGTLRTVASPTIAAGTRVRVTVSSASRSSFFDSRVERFRGTLLSSSPDTLYLALSNVDGSIAIPRTAVRRVETSLGTSRWPTAIKAGIVGAVLFGGRMWVAHEDPRTRRFPDAWQAVAVGSTAGFAAGAWLGSRHPSERWRAAR